MAETTNQSSARAQHNREVVEAFYSGGVRGDLSGIKDRLHVDFVCSAPNYLPWGGDSRGRDAYLNIVVPQVARFLDFGPFSYDSLTVEGDHAVALINVGIKGTDGRIKISEHWDFHEGLATRIWVAYFEPKVLMDAIAQSNTLA
jgi:hypothetical protein